MNRVLRIIEPNLTGNAGHYGEFIRCLAERSDGLFDRIEVHGGTGSASLELLNHPSIRVAETFGQGSPGEARILRDFAGDPSTPCLVLTAKSQHAVLAQIAALGGATLDHLRLYVHWKERALFQRMLVLLAPAARRGCRVITPVESTATYLRRQGWHRVEYVPYPVLAPRHVPPHEPRPARFLVAGAARMNKGLQLVADVAQRMDRLDPQIPLLVQTTGKRSGRQGAAEAEQLKRLARSNGAVQLDATPPGREEYSRRFAGAIVLTPYDPIKFADNVSGVALDALLHGAPIIATAGTWQAGLIQRFGCGVIMNRWTSEALADAMSVAAAEWTALSTHAREASRVLALEHDPRHAVAALHRPHHRAGRDSLTA
jgi:glycosyltransferase involved in cell wall biosynthesis